MDKVRFLLLQARNPGDPCRDEEADSFAVRLDVEAGQIACHDLLAGPPSPADVRRYDVLLMGGSGEFYVSKRNLPDFERLMELLAEVTLGGHPTFASCFGFHCLVEALGGEIIHDPPSAQVGTYELELTAEGKADPLVRRLPDRFMAQMGRKDRAGRMPEGIPNLVSSPLCPFLAFRVPDRPTWAFQFHPELDVITNRGRFSHYRDGYLHVMSVDDFERALEESFTDSPETERLPRLFLEHVFG